MVRSRTSNGLLMRFAMKMTFISFYTSATTIIFNLINDILEITNAEPKGDTLNLGSVNSNFDIE